MELPSNFFNHDAQAGGFYPLSHTGIDITNFGKHQNVLIEGIRGTGKTHVLRMIERLHFESFSTKRILPIFVSLAQISEHARKDPDEFRLHLYTHIVERCLETIETYQDDLQPDKNLLDLAIDTIRKMFGASIEPTLKKTISDLKQTAVDLQTELQFDLTSKAFTNTHVDGKSSSVKASGNLTIAAPKFMKVTAESEAIDTALEANTTEGKFFLMGSKLSHHNAVNFIIEFLKQVQILLNLDYSLILLDECSEASFSAQVEVFRLFKTIRGSNSRLTGKTTCAFFMGTVYPRGETYYPTREIDGFGFEPGHDCSMEFLQWDETDLTNYEAFFSEMTLNRAKEILAYTGSWTELKRELFDAEETFLLAAYSAHGIPRRYWELIKFSYDQASKKIIRGRVEVAIQEIANNQILGHPSITDADSNFVYHLVKILSDKNNVIRRKNTNKEKNPVPQNIYFSVNRRFKNLLRRLIMQGAIHDKSRMRTISKPKRPQPIFAVDMALVFTFRIIPPKNIVAVLAKDIPRSPKNDFDQAPEIWPRELKQFYEEVVITTHEESTSHSNEENLHLESTQGESNFDSFGKSSKAIDENELFDGIVRSYQKGRYGLIEVLDGGPFAYFSADQVDADYQDNLQPDDRVLFRLAENSKGRQALNIVVVDLTATIDDQKPQTEKVAEYIVSVVNMAEKPISLSELASQMQNYFGDEVRTTQWFGFMRFKNLLRHLDLKNLQLSPVSPGYIFAPDLHKAPMEPPGPGVIHFLDLPALILAIKDLLEKNTSGDSWVNQGELYSKIKRIDPEFDQRNFGFKKFGQLLVAADIFEIEKRSNVKVPGEIDYFVRLKQ